MKDRQNMKRFTPPFTYFKPKKWLILSAAFIMLATPIQPLAAPANDKETTIILSFDGMRHGFAESYVKKGDMPNLKKVKENGVSAERIVTVNPSLTATSHASIATGAKPEKTRFVSNEFHYPGTKVNETVDAFHAPINVSPLWSEVRKQGKVSAAIGFPGSNPKQEKQATYSVYYGETWSESAMETLKFEKAGSWKNQPKSFSEAKDAHFSIKVDNGKNHLIHVLAIDSTDNQQTDYDHFYVSEDLTIEDHDEPVSRDRWGALEIKVKKQQTAGFWFKVKKANKDLSSVKMYRTAVTSGMIDGPNNFEHEIKDKFGFFPDQDDLAGLQNGWITRKEYEEISSRFVQWITDVSLYIKERYQPDLLMFYTPQIDHEEHYYLLTDPRQPGYSKEKSERYMSHIRWAYQLADQTLGQTLKAMDKNDRLMVVSDHGMEPVHSMLSPNYELKEAGLLKLNDKGQIDVSQSKAYAVASGSVAHVYINLKGREKGGIVEEEEYEEVQNEIVEIFKDVKDERKLISRTKLAKHHFKTWRQSIEEDGLSWNSTKELFVSLYETVTDKDENPYGTVIKMDTKQAKNSERANAGDIILSASKGYIMGKNAKTPIEPAVELGSHGGNPARKELHPVFYAYGKGINPAIIERKITVLDIAPTVYEIMDLKAPSFVDGHPIKEIVKEETN